jgi:biotin transport system substrate-specific component
MNERQGLRMMVFGALMAALMAVGAYLSIPVGPVPIVLQNMFVLLAGLLLGSRWGAASVAVYLLAGAVGLPVFAGGLGGVGRLVGPTGGYLLGYLPAVWVAGFISEKTQGRIVGDVVAMACASTVVYACGVSWLKVLTAMTWSKTLVVGLYPFIVGDMLKIAAAAVIARALRPVMNK